MIFCAFSTCHNYLNTGLWLKVNMEQFNALNPRAKVTLWLQRDQFLLHWVVPSPPCVPPPLCLTLTSVFWQLRNSAWEGKKESIIFFSCSWIYIGIRSRSCHSPKDKGRPFLTPHAEQESCISHSSVIHTFQLDENVSHCGFAPLKKKKIFMILK